MSTIADISISDLQLTCEAGKTASVVLTAVSTSRRRMTFGARLIGAPGSSSGWLKLEGGVDRQLAFGETIQYRVTVAPPPEAPTGAFSFRLLVFDLREPGERFDESSSVSVTVSAAPTVSAPPLPVPRRSWRITLGYAALAFVASVIAWSMYEKEWSGFWSTWWPLAVLWPFANLAATVAWVRQSKPWLYCLAMFCAPLLIIALIAPQSSTLNALAGVVIVPYLFPLLSGLWAFIRRYRSENKVWPPWRILSR